MLKNNGVTDKFAAPKDAYSESHALIFHTLVCGDTVISQHEIQNHTLQAGKFVEKTAVKRTLNSILGNDDTETGWNDERILFDTAERLVWYKKASNTPTTLWFRTANHAIDVAVKLPTLIFSCDKQSRSTSLFAVAGTKRPTPDTVLYHAPLCNTGSEGSFCWGSATPPAYKHRHHFMDEAEDSLFDSAFTHINQPNTFSQRHGKTINTNEHIRIWCEFADKQRRPLASDMARTGKKLKNILQGRAK